LLSHRIRLPLWWGCVAAAAWALALKDLALLAYVGSAAGLPFDSGPFFLGVGAGIALGGLSVCMARWLQAPVGASAWLLSALSRLAPWLCLACALAQLYVFSRLAAIWPAIAAALALVAWALSCVKTPAVHRDQVVST
jgi:hypothetical protein